MLAINLIIFANQSFAADDSACFKHPTFAKNLGEEKAQPLIDELLKRNNSVPEEQVKNNETIPEGDSFAGMYQADISNDGKMKDILVFFNGGTLGVVDIFTLEHNNKNSKNLGPQPFGDMGFQNPGKDFLTQMCGNTYMVFYEKGDSGGRYHRTVYIWKNGKTEFACDDNWLNYERDSFQTLYQKQNYEKAYDQLNFYADTCKKFIKPQIALWIKNDLALAIQKTGDMQKSLQILATIEKDPNYSDASPALKKAVAFNKNKCSVILATPEKLDTPKGDKEYAWLLNRKLISSGSTDELFSKLISQAVPTGNPSDLFGIPDLTRTFATELGLRTIADGDAPRDGYYVNSNAIWNENSEVRGILWVNINEGTSVAGFLQGDKIAITSKFYSPQTIPTKAKQAIKKIAEDYFKEYSQPKAQVLFYDIEKKKTEKFPYAWLDNK